MAPRSGGPAHWRPASRRRQAHGMAKQAPYQVVGGILQRPPGPVVIVPRHRRTRPGISWTVRGGVKLYTS
jgi:hypothetical protein